MPRVYENLCEFRDSRKAVRVWFHRTADGPDGWVQQRALDFLCDNAKWTDARDLAERIVAQLEDVNAVEVRPVMVNYAEKRGEYAVTLGPGVLIYPEWP
jgi:hypothetical protein